MALLFMDSFDHYATADITEKWTTLAAGIADASTIAAVGRNGSNGIRLTHGGSSSNFSVQFHKVLGPSDATIIVGLAFRCVSAFTSLGSASAPDAPGDTPALISVRNSAATQAWIRINNNGTVSAYRGGTALGTTAVALTQNVYTFVEVRLTIHDSTGVVQIRFNGAEVLNLTGQNTRAGAANAWNELRLGPTNSNASASTEWNIDDLYVLDGSGAAPWNSFLGDCRVDARYPTGAGATTGWTPSAGANWQCVDETAPNDDTDYTAASAAALTDTFVVQDAPVAGAAIYGIQHCLSAKKTDAGAASIAPVVRHSGVDYVGADINPGTAYAFALQIAALNPGTAAAWTEAGFNAAEFGYKRTV